MNNFVELGIPLREPPEKRREKERETENPKSLTHINQKLT